MIKPSKISKIIIALLVITALAAIWHFDLTHFLSLNALKSQHKQLTQAFHSSPLSTVGFFFVIYVMVTGLSIPGATVLTLAAGALFGFWYGTLFVSFASTAGSCVSFLLARYLFRDAVQKKYHNKLDQINQGLQREGAYYLLALRLFAGAPFFLINLLMGLSKMRFFTFAWVSQVGMLAGTMIYVNAGTQLSKIETLSQILSWPIILSLSLLGLAPLILKRVVSSIKKQKTLGAYQKPKSFDYNLVVIGGGSAGLVSSYIASTIKAKVALIEKHKMGGDCLNTGCVPSKALIRSAKVIADAKRSQQLGFQNIDVEFDFKDILQRVQRVISKIEPHDSVERYQSLGVECLSGEAHIMSPYQIKVNHKIITTQNIIVATGASPLILNIPGLKESSYLTSDSLWNLTKLPKRLVILGGGPIGCELAQCFARFGSQVTLVEMGKHLLSREDSDVSKLIENQFKKEGITILTNHKAVRVEKNILYAQHKESEIKLPYDEMLVALGRKANVTGFGLEELGVELSDRKTIQCDDFMRTNFPNIYVCGDVSGPYQFTHTAAHQAWYASLNALLTPFKNFKIDYRVIPWATFTDPQVARVGLNEKEAQEKNIDHEVTLYPLDDLDRAIADEEDQGFVKVITAGKSDRILGATIVGSHGGDLIAEFVTAMKHGLGLNKILGTIHIYPTWTEANKYAAGFWKKRHAPQWALNLLQKFFRWRRS